MSGISAVCVDTSAASTLLVAVASTLPVATAATPAMMEAAIGKCITLCFEGKLCLLSLKDFMKI